MGELDELALTRARELIAVEAGVEVLSEWRQQSNSAVWMLKLRLELCEAEPTAAVPHFTEWEVVVDFEVDRWGRVQIYPALGEYGLLHSFSHQRFNGDAHPKLPCRNGHICTPTRLGQLAKNRGAVQDEPTSTVERICWHVTRALGWVQSAALGTLMASGDFLELPDFAEVKGSKQGVLAYYENEDSYRQWQQQKARSGIAYVASSGLTYLIHRFMDVRNESLVYQPAWGKAVTDVESKNLTQGLWIRLDEIPVVKTYQVPHTVGELQEALAEQGQDLNALLKPLWASYNLAKDAFAYILVGMPVVKRIGEPPLRYHWQMIWLPVPSPPRFPLTSKDVLKQRLTTPQTTLRWVKLADNWHPDDLQNRGRLPAALCEARILVLGAGALGSLLSEQLVRMGVRQLTLVDGDGFEAGNLVRHALTLDNLYNFKADALAQRLNLVNPSAWVSSVAKAIPTDSPEFAQAGATADLIIDVTADDDVLRLMPLPELNPTALFVTCSLSLQAAQLFFYAIRTVDFDQVAFNTWFEPFRVKEEKLAQRLDMPRGAGCWHPYTPAPLNRVAGLAGAAVELLAQVYEQPVELPVKLSYTWSVPTLVPAATVAVP